MRLSGSHCLLGESYEQKTKKKERQKEYFIFSTTDYIDIHLSPV